MKRFVSPVIALILICVLVLTFQNCAKDFSPSDYSQQESSSTTPPEPDPIPQPAPTPDPSPILCYVYDSNNNAIGIGEKATDSSPCIATACNAGYHIENQTCMSDVKACEIANASAAQQTWSASSSSYGACTVLSCNSGYNMSGNSCLLMQPIYRYFKSGAGHYWSKTATDSAAGSLGYGSAAGVGKAEGQAFAIYATQNSGQVPLYLCKFSSNSHGATVSCPGSSIFLGYMSVSSGAHGATKPIYYCSVSSLTGKPMTTAVSSDCGSAAKSVIGYGI